MAIITREISSFTNGGGELLVLIEENSVTGQLRAFQFENTTTREGRFTVVRSNGEVWIEVRIPLGSSRIVVPADIKNIEADLDGYWTSPLWQ